MQKKELKGWLLLAGLCLGIYLYADKQAAKIIEPTEPEVFADYGEYWPPDADPLEAEAPVMQIEQASAAPRASQVRAAKRADMWRLEDGSVDYFRCIIIETKRREAMGRPGAELKRYKDGREWAIGYGNHIRYLSEYWQRTCKHQGWRVTEAQARSMMYETFHGLCEQVKRDLPNTNRRQQLAVASLAFNWGYGNVKRSGLWRHLKAGRTNGALEAAWMRTQVATENHRKSRRMEVVMWRGQDKTVLTIAKTALADLRNRGDFKHY